MRTTDSGASVSGREVELGVLAEMLDALETAGNALVLQIAGEPGIGKSRLLRELTSQARSRGHLVLSGRAAEFEAEHPFGVFGDALDGSLLDQGHERLEALASGLAAELAMVFPAFGPLASARVQLQQEERYRAYRAVRGMLSSLARTAPIVLVLDDVQWADPGSVELIGHLLAHPCQGPVLLALAYRPAQISPRLSAALAAALKDPSARRLTLRPVSPDAARMVLGRQVPRAVADRLYEESGGNPFYLLQLARGNTLTGPHADAGGAIVSGVPEAVRASLARELSSLSAPALLLLQGAAIAGDPFEPSLAAGAAGLRASEALDLSDELLQSQLIHPTAVGGEFAFRHPIVRATVYELASSGWRVRAHGRIAATLASDHATAEAQAPHIERSAEKGDHVAIAVLVEAAGSAARRAPALAARWYEAALRLLPDAAGTEDHRIDLLMARANAMAGLGELDQARGTLCEVLERLPTKDPGRLAIVAACAGVEHMLGRHRDARSRLTLAYRTQQDARSLPAVLLQVELAAGAGYECRPEDQIAWAEQALEGATLLGERAIEVLAAGQLALGLYFLGLPAVDAMERAAAGLDALDDAELAARLDIAIWVGWSESCLERNERAVEHLQRMIDVARATGQGAALRVTMAIQSWSLMHLGRLDEAEEVLSAAIEAGYLAPHMFQAIAVGFSSVLATYRGDFAGAVRAGEEAVQLARSADSGLNPMISALCLAIPLIELGDARRARATMLAPSGGADLQTQRWGHAAAYEVLTRAELSLGDVDAAARWARKADAEARDGQLGFETAFARRATAAVALARGDAEEAARIALDGARGADDAGAPVEAGRCRILAARALVQAGRRADALAELDNAAQQLARVGAHGYLPQAEEGLQRLGAPRARRRTSDPHARDEGLRSLTDRERAVAELVGRGHTNREIATTIFVSEKTVERLVSRIFAKLGVARRTELALRVAAELAAPAESLAAADDRAGG